MDVAQRLTLDGNRDVDLSHAGLAHGIREVAGILHDARMDLVEELQRLLVAKFRIHRIEQIEEASAAMKSVMPMRPSWSASACQVSGMSVCSDIR